MLEVGFKKLASRPGHDRARENREDTRDSRDPRRSSRNDRGDPVRETRVSPRQALGRKKPQSIQHAKQGRKERVGAEPAKHHSFKPDHAELAKTPEARE